MLSESVSSLPSGQGIKMPVFHSPWTEGGMLHAGGFSSMRRRKFCNNLPGKGTAGGLGDQIKQMWVRNGQPRAALMGVLPPSRGSLPSQTAVVAPKCS